MATDVVCLPRSVFASAIVPFGVLFAFGICCQAQDAGSNLAAIAVVEQADYSGRVEQGTIVDGTFRLKVARRGQGGALLDWSDVRIAVHDLRWDGAPAEWGTTPDGQFIVVVPERPGELTGKWSLNGRAFGPRTHFDLKLPQALNSVVSLTVPDSAELAVKPGIAVRPLTADPPEPGVWRIDLGRNNQAIVFLEKTSRPASPQIPRYEIDSLHVARRDGVFIQTDLMIESPQGAPKVDQLTLRIPGTLEIQSVSLGGIPLSWSTARMKNEVAISLDRVILETRSTLRIRGFQATRWGRRRQLPVIQLVDGRLIRRTLALRIEPPLRLLSAEPEGMVQTSLTSDESTGEVWRFEATKAEGRLFVEIDEPRPESLATVGCLVDSRRQAAWTACHLQIAVENGASFESRIQLPADWKLVAVSPADSESRIASWSVKDQLLTVQWQNPLTQGTPRQAMFFAYASALPVGQPVLLEMPVVRETVQQHSTVQVLLPSDTRLDLLETESWKLVEKRPVFPTLQRDSDLASRLGDMTSIRPVTLESRGGTSPTRTMIQLVPLIRPASDGDAGGRPESPPADTTAVNGDAGNFDSVTASCRLSTSVGQPSGPALVHHASLIFDRELNLAGFEATLPEPCQLSSVIADGESVSVIRNEHRFRFPQALRTVRQIELTYVTPSGSGYLESSHTVPLPDFGIAVRYFTWSIELPDSLGFAAVEIPGIMAERPQGPGLMQRMFGPLGRERGESVFAPLSPTSWSRLFPDPDAAQGQDPRRRWQLQSPVVGNSVRFSVWNLSRTRGLAWVALLGCLLVGSGARLFRIKWIVQIAAVWIALLGFLTTILPVSFSHICGAMLVGSLISVLIPRRIIGKNDFWSRDERSRLVIPVAAATVVVAAVWLTYTSSTTAQDFIDGKPAVPRIPASLIRQAHYRVTGSGTATTPSVSARFEVLLNRQTPPRLLQLPFQNVVFPTRSQCLVNGVSAPLIPSITGDAIVIDLSEVPVPFALSESPWFAAVVELEFIPRVSASDDADAARSWTINAVVPRILDTQLEAFGSQFDLMRWGGRSALDDGAVRLELGGIGRLATPMVSPNPTVVEPLVATTTVELSALRFDGTTRISAETGILPETLRLELPAEIGIRSVTGPSLIDWYASPLTGGTREIVVRTQPEARSPVAIAWELPPPPSQEVLLTIPAFSFGREARIRHLLGVTNVPALEVRLPEGIPLRLLAPEELQQNADFSRIRPSLAVSLVEPVPLSLTLKPRSPQRSIALDEVIRIRRDGLAWTANVTIDVDEIAVFQHSFLLDPEVKIDSVAIGGDAKSIPLRHSRRGNMLDVFLPGGQIQERTLVVQGRKPMSHDVWAALPTLESQQGTIRSRRLKVYDETGWSVELEATDGHKSTRTAEDVSSADPGMGERLIGDFSGNDASRPVRVRTLIPPAAIQADSVTSVQRSDDEEWELQSLFRLRPREVSLRKAVFSIPEGLKFSRIRPAHLRHAVSRNEQGTFVNVFVPDRDASGTTVTLVTRPEDRIGLELDTFREQAAPVAVPLPRTVNALEGTRLLVLPGNSSLRPAVDSVNAVAAEGLPDWLPTEWRLAVLQSEMACFQLKGEVLRFAEPVGDAGIRPPKIVLEETIIWPADREKTRAVTRVWPEIAGDNVLWLQAGEPVAIDAVLTEFGEQIEFQSARQGIAIPIRSSGGRSSLLIYWQFAGNATSIPRLEYRDQSPERRLLAIAQTPEMPLKADGIARLDCLEAVLLRWQSLMEILSIAPTTTYPVDGEILRGIRECQRIAGGLVQESSPSVTDDRSRLYYRLSQDWNRRRAELPVSGDLEQSTAPIAEDPFVDLLGRDESPERVFWYDVSLSEGPVPVGRTFSLAFPAASIITCLLLLGSLLLLIRYQASLSRLRERVAVQPAIALALLGVLWWLFLSPSVLGFFLIALAGVVRFWESARRSRWITQFRESVFRRSATL